MPSKSQMLADLILTDPENILKNIDRNRRELHNKKAGPAL